VVERTTIGRILIEMHAVAGIFDMVVFELGAPVRRKTIFEPDAQQHACQCAGTVFQETASVGAGEGEAAVRDTGLAVDERAVESEAGAHRDVGAPAVAGEHRRAEICGVGQARPRLGLEAEDHDAVLNIAAELAAGETAAAMQEVLAIKPATGNKSVAHRAAAAMRADVTAVPIVDCRRRHDCCFAGKVRQG